MRTESRHPHEFLFRTLSSGQPPPYCGAEEELRFTLTETGLAGYFHSRGWTRTLPPETAAFAAFSWKRQWVHNQMLLRELQDIRASAAVPVVALKGASLLERIYPDLGSRALSDLDVFIDGGDFETLATEMRARGYRLADTELWRANDHKRVFHKFADGREIVIETHQKLHWTEPKGFRWQVNGDASLLRAEDELLYLLVHLVSQHSFLRLAWLIDIDRYIRSFGESLDWPKLRARALELGQWPGVALGLAVANHFLGTPLPESMNDRRSALIARHLLNERFLCRPSEDRFLYYAVKHLGKGSILEALRYDVHWIANSLRGFADKESGSPASER